MQARESRGRESNKEPGPSLGSEERGERRTLGRAQSLGG